MLQSCCAKRYLEGSCFPTADPDLVTTVPQLYAYPLSAHALRGLLSSATTICISADAQ